jgi:hypothetical protein
VVTSGEVIVDAFALVLLRFGENRRMSEPVPAREG